MEIGLYAVYAVLLWWASTGVILYLDGLPRRTFSYSLAGASLLALAGFVGLALSAGHATPAGAVIGFTSALAIWGWHELTFLTGHITGPRRTPMPEGLAGFARFRAAAATVSDHEIGIALTAAALAFVTWGEPNQMALATFLLLWVMRLSTKLNIFLGAPNIADEFLPPHLGYLKSYFRRRPMNGLFPFAITGATLLTAYLAHKALGGEADSFQTASYALLTVLSALAVLEHWLLYLPLPASALWKWGLASHQKTAETEALHHAAAQPSVQPPASGDGGWSVPLDRPCDPRSLTELLEAVAGGRYGEVERVEGAARLRDGWLRFRMTNGRPFLAQVSSLDGDPARVTAFGREFDRARLGAAFQACAA